MSLKNVEEVETSLPDVQSVGFWKKKMMQLCNIGSTPQHAAYVTKMQQISIYLAVNVTFKYITDARPFYRHNNFENLLERKANRCTLIVLQQV